MFGRRALGSLVLLRRTLYQIVSVTNIQFDSFRKLLKNEIICELLNSVCVVEMLYDSALYEFTIDIDI